MIDYSYKFLYKSMKYSKGKIMLAKVIKISVIILFIFIRDTIIIIANRK